MTEETKPQDETREHVKYAGVSRMGKSTCIIICPFCKAETTAFVWSLAGSGKKCSNEDCGAIHGSIGVSRMPPPKARKRPRKPVQDEEPVSGYRQSVEQIRSLYGLIGVHTVSDAERAFFHRLRAARDRRRQSE